MEWYGIMVSQGLPLLFRKSSICIICKKTTLPVSYWSYLTSMPGTFIKYFKLLMEPYEKKNELNIELP